MIYHQDDNPLRIRSSPSISSRKKTSVFAWYYLACPRDQVFFLKSRGTEESSLFFFTLLLISACSKAIVRNLDCVILLI